VTPPTVDATVPLSEVVTPSTSERLWVSVDDIEALSDDAPELTRPSVP
jgi:hypothetical protein